MSIEIEQLHLSRKQIVVWRMTADEAEDVGYCLQTAFPMDDGAWVDGRRLIDLATEIKNPDSAEDLDRRET